MSDVLNYLKSIYVFHQNPILRPDFKYHSIEAFVLKNGKEMGKRSERSDNYPKAKQKECFRNAYLLAVEHDLTYCEGYAMGIIPVLHAWCLDKDDLVIDVTWKDGTEYVGVPFQTKYISRILLERKSYGIIDNWEMKWPLLRGEKF